MPSALVGKSNERVKEVVHELRTDNCLKRHLRTEHVPTAEHRAFDKLSVTLMNLIIPADIPAVHILINARVYHSVIKRSIEYGPLRFRSAFDVYATECVVPIPNRFPVDAVEVSALSLSLKIASRAFNINIRNSTSESNGFILISSKVGKEAFYSLDDDHVVTLMQQGLDHVLHG